MNDSTAWREEPEPDEYPEILMKSQHAYVNMQIMLCVCNDS